MHEPGILVTPWPNDQKPPEHVLQRLLAEENLKPYRWSNGPHDVYRAHMHPYNKVLYVVSGSITFGLPESGKYLTLHAGDRLDLPKGVVHSAVVGPHGVICLEAQC
ncbi:MAG: cupin domain-containing protein [Candidatus Promineifilaceae bacterium]|jgi:quercetin dioxygenase-like cupin family protein